MNEELSNLQEDIDRLTNKVDVLQYILSETLESLSSTKSDSYSGLANTLSQDLDNC